MMATNWAFNLLLREGERNLFTEKNLFVTSSQPSLAVKEIGVQKLIRRKDKYLSLTGVWQQLPIFHSSNPKSALITNITFNLSLILSLSSFCDLNSSRFYISILIFISTLNIYIIALLEPLNYEPHRTIFLTLSQLMSQPEVN